VRHRAQPESAARDVAQTEPVGEAAADDKGFTGVRPWAIDTETAKRLWSTSKEMLGEALGI